jgi:hypothetical protein
LRQPRINGSSHYNIGECNGRQKGQAGVVLIMQEQGSFAMVVTNHGTFDPVQMPPEGQKKVGTAS